jgi:hypothetical protein
MLHDRNNHFYMLKQIGFLTKKIQTNNNMKKKNPADYTNRSRANHQNASSNFPHWSLFAAGYYKP